MATSPSSSSDTGSVASGTRPPTYLARETLFEHRRGDPREPVILPFAADAFDLVFSVGVLEHVHEAGGDARGSILEIERVLKPGGHFLCFHLPNRYAWGKIFGRS